MSLKSPDSMDECLYFTNRSIGEGYATAWVYRKECPKCKKGRLGKPIKKNGKTDKKAAYYECPACSYEGEATSEYKRKTFEGIQSFVFECGKCNKKIGITKKMKKSKKSKEADAAGD